MTDDKIDTDRLSSQLPDGWAIDRFDGDDPYCVTANNRNTDTKLHREVVVEVEYANHDHYNTRYWASYWSEHPLPNLGPEETSVECDTVEDAINQAVEWAANPP